MLETKDLADSLYAKQQKLEVTTISKLFAFLFNEFVKFLLRRYRSCEETLHSSPVSELLRGCLRGSSSKLILSLRLWRQPLFERSRKMLQ